MLSFSKTGALEGVSALIPIQHPVVHSHCQVMPFQLFPLGVIHDMDLAQIQRYLTRHSSGKDRIQRLGRAEFAAKWSSSKSCFDGSELFLRFAFSTRGEEFARLDSRGQVDRKGGGGCDVH